MTIGVFGSSFIIQIWNIDLRSIIKTGNIYGESPYPGGTLKTTDGKDYKTVIQQWNKKNTYLTHK